MRQLAPFSFIQYKSVNHVVEYTVFLYLRVILLCLASSMCVLCVRDRMVRWEHTERYTQ